MASGMTLNDTGRNDGAIEQFDKVLELEPNYSLSHSRLGYAYPGRYGPVRNVYLHKVIISREH